MATRSQANRSIALNRLLEAARLSESKAFRDAARSAAITSRMIDSRMWHTALSASLPSTRVLANIARYSKALDAPLMQTAIAQTRVADAVAAATLAPAIRQATASFAAIEASSRLLRDVTSTLNSRLFDVSWLEAANKANRLAGLGRLVESLPSFDLIRESMRELQDAADVFESEGFGFVINPLPAELLRGATAIDRRVRAAAVTNRMLGFTRSPEFAQNLQETFAESRLESSRWPPVRAALGEHIDRGYLLSIPVFLAQAEGLLGDALLLRNLVRRSGSRLYAVNPDGTFKKNKKGKHIELKGAGGLATESRSVSDLTEISSFILDGFVGPRNAILHGRLRNYRRPKLSVQTLLLTSLLAEMILAFERRKD